VIISKSGSAAIKKKLDEIVMNIGYIEGVLAQAGINFEEAKGSFKIVQFPNGQKQPHENSIEPNTRAKQLALKQAEERGMRAGMRSKAIRNVMENLPEN